MLWQAHPFSVLLFITAIVAATVALIAWNRRVAPGARPLALFNLGAGVWGFTDAMFVGSTRPQARGFWLRGPSFGVIIIPTGHIVFPP